MLGPTDGPHGNRRARRERVANVSLRPTEAACFRVQKCANNHQLVVAGIQRCVQYTYSACFRVIHTRKTLHALRTYIRKQWLAYVSYTETVKRVHVLHKVKSVLLLWHHLDFTQTKKELNYSRARKQSNFFSSVINGLQEYTSCPMLNSSKLNKNYWAKTVDYLKYSE